MDNFGGMRGVALAARRESWRASVKRAGKSWGANGKSFGLYLL